jgi:hypothetical protein
MRYRIEIDSPKHRAHGWFISFDSQYSREGAVVSTVAHFEEDGRLATWFDLPTARLAVRRLREPQYHIRCRILDEHGSVMDNYGDVEQNRPVDIFNSHENLTWRDRAPDGRLIELPIVCNRAYNPPRFYFRFSTGPTGNEEPDRSIQGSSPAECWELFVTNPHFEKYVGRYEVQPLPPPETTPAAPPAPMITIEKGYEVVGYRPGSIKQ